MGKKRERRRHRRRGTKIKTSVPRIERTVGEIGNTIRMNGRWSQCSFVDAMPLNSLLFPFKASRKNTGRLGDSRGVRDKGRKTEMQRLRRFIVAHKNLRANRPLGI